MKKSEFLKEISYGLSGRMNQSEIEKIVKEYEIIFDSKNKKEKSEEEIVVELGSPAKIVRKILENGVLGNESKVKQVGGEIERKISSSAEKIYEKASYRELGAEASDLASMTRRLAAYVIDGFLLGVIAVAVVLTISSLLMKGGNSDSTILTFIPLFIMALLLGLFNIFSVFFIWLTDGYTPGKWILKIRVKKCNGEKLKFWDAIMREAIVKSIANAVISGFLNVGSFLWGCATEDHKTVQDLCAKTIVAKVK